jgi:hypothetical protein
MFAYDPKRTFSCLSAWIVLSTAGVIAMAAAILSIFASVHFRPDRLVFQDSVATTTGSQPFDPAAA